MGSRDKGNLASNGRREQIHILGMITIFVTLNTPEQQV